MSSATYKIYTLIVVCVLIIAINPTAYCGRDGNGNFSSSSSSNSGTASSNKSRLEKLSSKLLCVVAARNDVKAIEKLVEMQKVDVNVKNELGETALHYAVYFGSVEAIKKLIELGAKVNIEDKSGNTPLHIACYGKLMKDLVEPGNGINVDEEKVDFNEIVKALLEGDDNDVKKAVNAKDKFRHTPLGILCEMGLNELILMAFNGELTEKNFAEKKEKIEELVNYLKKYDERTSKELAKEEVVSPPYVLNDSVDGTEAAGIISAAERSS